MKVVLKIEDVCYTYGQGQPILTDVNAEFELGKMYSIVGPSGSGKTTLLSVLSGLESPKSGKLVFASTEITGRKVAEYRSKDVSIVFQNYNLLTYMTALQNVTTAMEIRGMKENVRQQARIFLQEVGLSEQHIDQPILTLSGGQQQRVAIARALACGAEIIFADEPTGNLDAKTAKEIMTLFQRIAKEENKCVILVTHDQKVTEACDVTLTIQNEKLVVI
ncbi:MAG: ABC transporter ATP-binding protein [Bacilli bacterium]